jgi:hypothetical protein
MYRAIKFTGSLSQDCTITIAPNTAPAWFIIENAAGDDIILSQGSGANVTVQNGKNVIVYCDGAGSGAAVVDALADLQIGTLECTGAAAIDGAATFSSTVTVGVDDTGYDVKFFGATSGAYMLWDESADDLKLVGAAGLTVAGDIDVDGTTNLDAVDIDGATQIDGTITVGVDDTGYDVKFFGATSGAYMLWDESADDLKLVGAAGLTVAGDIDVDGTTNLDAVDVDGAVNFAADVTFADGADIITASAGTSNFRAGVNAGNSIESGGNYNVAVGDEAGTAITTGDNNVVVGYTAGDAITTGSGNVMVGYACGTANTTGIYNTAVGHQALATAITDNRNVAVGYNALLLCEGGGSNVFVGSYAGDALTTGDENTCMGDNAGTAITTGSDSVAFGSNALAANTTADNNTAIGMQALKANTTGTMNTVLGKDAGLAITTAENNTCIGFATGDALTTGNGNVHIGGGAGGAQTTGTSSICIGVNAGSNLVDNTAGNAMIIGYGAQASASNVGGHELVLGPGTAKGVNTAFVVAGGSVYKGDNGTAWAQTSDRRIKKDIQPNTKGLAEICQVDPKTFLYKSDEELHEIPEFVGCAEGLPQDKRVTSAIAQDVQVPFPEAVTERNDYGMLTVNTDPIFWAMVNSIKELSAQVDELKAEIHVLKGE